MPMEKMDMNSVVNLSSNAMSPMDLIEDIPVSVDKCHPGAGYIGKDVLRDDSDERLTAMTGMKRRRPIGITGFRKKDLVLGYALTNRF
jgi:hypothetical protein